MTELQSIKAINSFKQTKGAYTTKVGTLRLMCDVHQETFGKDVFPKHLK